MRLLLVEDDVMIGESIEEELREQGYAVDWVRDGVSAELALKSHDYDLILLDLGLPRKQGLDVLIDFRRHGGEVPVLIITARDAVDDRVKGLDAGSDDYLVKPFDLEELDARVRALLRRGFGRTNPEIHYHDLVLNPATHEVYYKEQLLTLSGREFSVLHALMDPPGEVVSRKRLEEKLYSWGEEVESNTLDVFIHHLRKKLDADIIRTVRGVGFKLANKLNL